jgi:hypothetical protein
MLVLTDEELPMGELCDLMLYSDPGDLQIEARGKVIRTYVEGIAIQFEKLLGVDNFVHLLDLVRSNLQDVETIEAELRAHMGTRRLE